MALNYATMYNVARNAAAAVETADRSGMPKGVKREGEAKRP